VIGQLGPEQAAAKLREMGETDLADAVDEVAQEGTRDLGSFGLGGDFWSFLRQPPQPWQHTAHAFGYLAATPPGSEMVAIQYAGNITPDANLKNARINIALQRLRVASYPGGGLHNILVDFYAQNQATGTPEDVHFNATYRVQEGEQAGIVGYPIFIGLNVGAQGMAFKCFTVNVQNDADKIFLSVLDSDVFKNGLKVAAAIQPAIAPLSQIAMGMTKAIAQRNQNVAVQNFYLGLDFSNIGLGARLAEGSYIAVQIPETLQAVWDWSAWVYNPNTGQIVNKQTPTQLIPYNYLVFSVSRYTGD